MYNSCLESTFFCQRVQPQDTLEVVCGSWNPHYLPRVSKTSNRWLFGGGFRKTINSMIWNFPRETPSNGTPLPISFLNTPFWYKPRHSGMGVVWEWGVFLGTTTPPRWVTTRIIPFLVGNPYKASFVTVTGWRVDWRYSHYCFFL